MVVDLMVIDLGAGLLENWGGCGDSRVLRRGCGGDDAASLLT